ncbi:MAG: DUF3038 domain-containing protein [Leptolyngbyaceae cyanobacterium bins.59]|nr:DUF3038 domain-containing protein [Leptolyngbyaceae cyanobacterium bins.59]
MSPSENVMQLNSPSEQSHPLILESLPTPSLPDGGCPRRTRLQIDLILLAIEALDLGGAEAILMMIDELGLKSVISNRVALWRLRSTNPLRRFSQRRPMSITEAKALVVIASQLARRLTVLIRQLLLAQQLLDDKQLSAEHNFRLSDYLDRFRAHFRSRMNPRRVGIVSQYFGIDLTGGVPVKPGSLAIATYNDDRLNDLALYLLGQLLFCTGTTGMQRFWVSLFDGEVE